MRDWATLGECYWNAYLIEALGVPAIVVGRSASILMGRRRWPPNRRLVSDLQPTNGMQDTPVVGHGSLRFT